MAHFLHVCESSHELEFLFCFIANYMPTLISHISPHAIYSHVLSSACHHLTLSMQKFGAIDLAVVVIVKRCAEIEALHCRQFMYTLLILYCIRNIIVYLNVLWSG